MYDVSVSCIIFLWSCQLPRDNFDEITKVSHKKSLNFRVKTKVSTLTQLSTLLTTLTKPLIVKKMWTKFFRIPRCSNDNCRFQGNFIAVFCLDCFIKRQKCSYLKVDFKIPPSTTQMSTPASHGLVGWWTRTRFLKSKQNKVKSRKKDWVWNWSNASRVRALLLFDPSGKNPSLWESRPLKITPAVWICWVSY